MALIKGDSENIIELYYASGTQTNIETITELYYGDVLIWSLNNSDIQEDSNLLSLDGLVLLSNDNLILTSK